MYLIADIVWSVQVAALKNYIDGELESSSVCLQNVLCTSEPIRNTDSYLQLDISLVRCIATLYLNGEQILQVFGWLTMVIWAATLWFLFKDTTFFKDPKAPWAKKTETGPPSGVQQNPVQGEAGHQNGKSISLAFHD